MTIEVIIFNIIKANTHTWVRYWLNREISGLTMPGEYIEIRSSFLSDPEIQSLLDNGFKIQKITTQKINADAYCDVLFKREISTTN